MRKFGLIGYPLTKSFSKPWFNEKFAKEGIDAYYEIYPIEDISSFKDFIIKNNDISGLNVTIPHKQSVMPFLNNINTEAAEIGAVNVIKIVKNSLGENELTGYNTDLFGFRESVRPYIDSMREKGDENLKALILGTGGASKAVKFGLNQLNIETLYVSRTSGVDCISYEELNSSHYNDYHVIVNTTPLGMNPDFDTCPPLDYSQLDKRHFLFDAVYNPDKTKFLRLGEENGATIKNGLEMLHLQAKEAWKIWNF